MLWLGCEEGLDEDVSRCVRFRGWTCSRQQGGCVRVPRGRSVIKSVCGYLTSFFERDRQDEKLQDQTVSVFTLFWLSG